MEETGSPGSRETRVEGGALKESKVRKKRRLCHEVSILLSW